MCPAMVAPGSAFSNKMATGSGKTALMGMIITWQTLNAISYPKDGRFSRAIFINGARPDGEEPFADAQSRR